MDLIPPGPSSQPCSRISLQEGWPGSQELGKVGRAGTANTSDNPKGTWK